MMRNLPDYLAHHPEIIGRIAGVMQDDLARLGDSIENSDWPEAEKRAAVLAIAFLYLDMGIDVLFKLNNQNKTAVKLMLNDFIDNTVNNLDIDNI